MTDTKAIDALKPCPFCGETAKMWCDLKVSCTNTSCGCYRESYLGVPKDNAVPFYAGDWNTRSEVTPIETDEKLREAVFDIQKRVWRMCENYSGPKMTIPPQPDDDDLAIQVHLKTIEAALAELERLRKASQWQPIETAPRDGTSLWLTRIPYTGNKPLRPRLAWWSDSERTKAVNKGKAGWRTPRNGRSFSPAALAFEPTHYCIAPQTPLPPPPAEENK